MADDVSRRRFLQTAAAGTGLVLAGFTPALTGCVWRPGDRPAPGLPEGTDLLPDIDHIIVYMQENHSYDSYFGTLGRGDGYRMQGGAPTNSNVMPDGTVVPVFHSDETCQPGRGVSQNWVASHRQVNEGRMDGFLADGNTNAMKYWDETEVPFYRSLASTFTLCDRWFASAPAQTYPNRMYLQAGTCQDLIATDVAKAASMPMPAGGLIWQKLNAHGITWKDYAWDLPDIALYPSFWQESRDHVKTFAEFLDDCRTGALPSVSIVSPGITGYSEENPNDIQLGEAYSASIINAVLGSPAWPRTVLVFMYDEHGGYYDHVAPPRAVPPDDIPPAVAPAPGAPAAWDRYGLRVPGFVISPFSRPDYVSHVVHDHTSVLRFIETKFNLGALTRRDANASNLLDCLDFSSPAFLDPPTLAAPGLPVTGSACQPDVPPPPTGATVRAAAPAERIHGLGDGAVAAATQTGTLELSDSQDERVEHLKQLIAWSTGNADGVGVPPG